MPRDALLRPARAGPVPPPMPPKGERCHEKVFGRHAGLGPGPWGLNALNASATLKINLGVVTKPGSAQNVAAEKFKELVEARSKGAIKVKIHHLRLPGQRD